MTTSSKPALLLCQDSKAWGRRPVLLSSVLPIGVARIDGSAGAWTDEGARKRGALTADDVLVREAQR